jgi:hypothetical protein
MRRNAGRLVLVALAAALFSPAASAYYYWIYFSGRTGIFNPVPARFDLNALSDKTVYFYISDQGPSAVSPDDSAAAIYSQIRFAARTWNEVETSDLRLRFGGFTTPGTLQTTPGIDVVFSDDIPDGILEQTWTMTVDDVSPVANGATFVPIVRSRIELRRDLSDGAKYASYNEDFFLTLVHEFGHALGLQHTLTSGVMSTSRTRATRKAKPLAADDIAGISLLYPAADFAARTGSIKGRVTLNGQGVNMASVVALAASGAAVSALANPDGSYRIDGIPPGQYYVYAHPLPPAVFGESRPANIDAPLDAAKNPFAANTGFDTQFYPGTKEWSQASQVAVGAGASVENINFSMQARSSVAMHSVTLYGYVQDQYPVQAAPLVAGGRYNIVFTGVGVAGGNGQVTPGLSASFVGNGAQVIPATLRAYQNPYLLLGVDLGSSPADAPAHLALRTANDLYVLPAAITAVAKQPPAIRAVTPGLDDSGNRVVTITGSSLWADARVYFDGAPATAVRGSSDGTLTVSVPVGANNYAARVSVLNNDGQSSLLVLGSEKPPLYTYDGPDSPAAATSPNVLPAGVDAMVEVNGFNTTFVEGQTVVGFGSSDIVVKRVWVVSPSRMVLNISISPNASPGPVPVTIATALQVIQVQQALQIQATNAGQFSMRAPVVNQATELAGVPSGGLAVIFFSGSVNQLSGATLTIAEQRAPFSMTQNGRILAQVPSGLVPGPAVVRLHLAAGDPVPPIVMQLDGPPPVIQSAAVAGVSIDSAHPARIGDTVTMIVQGLSDNGSISPSLVHINLAGTDHIAKSVIATSQPGASEVQFVVRPGTPTGAVSATVGVDTRISGAITLTVRQ